MQILLLDYLIDDHLLSFLKIKNISRLGKITIELTY